MGTVLRSCRSYKNETKKLALTAAKGKEKAPSSFPSINDNNDKTNTNTNGNSISISGRTMIIRP